MLLFLYLPKVPKSLAFFLLFTSFAWSFAIRQDDPKGFSLADSVQRWHAIPCPGNRVRLDPERSEWSEQAKAPVRWVRIALPGAQMPRLELQIHASKDTSAQLCDADDAPLRSSQSSLQTHGPLLRDGTWVLDVGVPLVRATPVGAHLVTSYSLQVTFTESPTGRRPGARLLASVANPTGARRFAVKPARSALRKGSWDNVANVEWIAKIKVGDRELATMAEDGRIAVAWTDLDKALRSTPKQSALAGVSIDRLQLFGANPDTLVESMGAEIPRPDALAPWPLEIRDHNGPNDPNPNGIWDSGDTLFFYATGTSLWKRVDLEDPAKAGLGMEYYFSSSPFSFENSFFLTVLSSGQGSRMAQLPTLSGGQAVDSLWRYVRAEKDVLLRDAYFGRLPTGWEQATGKEWFWAWAPSLDTLRLSSTELSMAQTKDLPGISAGHNAYISISWQPKRPNQSG